MTIFTSPAQCYSEYRPRYPQRLIDDLRERTVGERGQRLIDWGCGTGELAIPLSPHFDRVTAIDAVAEMIAMAEANGQRDGVENVEWLTGRAEQLELAPESCDLIVAGSAFHWMDRELLARRALTALGSGGALALAAGAGGGAGNIQRRSEEWHGLAVECLNGYAGDRPTEPRRRKPETTRAHQDFLGPAGFRVERHEYPTDYSWRAEEAVGFLYSIGVVSPHLLGDGREDFERELCDALDRLDPAGGLHERIDYNLTIAYKP
ncbi:MAG TPA: class I SAM-dependent methyltransferase [Solirubrobacterales bacterium]|nr:class I SAM-dependent methyltransferase [Solirubrobacterales bacterium]